MHSNSISDRFFVAVDEFSWSDDLRGVLLQEDHRPLFTIAVLVSGVVGGLAVVIAVVYLYRFCLKKRPPVTT
ncbi:unnamed protein product [Angiostrongylus costaricensis]|uniref:Cadherin_C_2 domain-containing protein n=1 Tax=Angiostrongylus costaricensis TaxID=334426 RepID=A0A0R3PAY2_ANGCS|nr:unnamed protein product [Angiostrongylus costaricensis]